MERVITTTLVALGLLAATAAAEDFSVVHLSDTHLNPRQAGAAKSPPRGAATLTWIADVTGGEIQPPGLDGSVPAPRFAVISGDVFEYGAIGDSWAHFDEVFAALPYPVYPAAGNHDLTWNLIVDGMRARFGGEHYSWDSGGVHFAALSSASPLEPLPSFNARTRAWLADDLAALPAGTPVVLTFHHPPSDGTLAGGERDTLLDLLRDYNVVLLLYGHGHSVRHARHEGIDAVMGGSTFGPNAGHGLLSIRDGQLHYDYRYHEKRPRGHVDGWQHLLSKSLVRAVPPRQFSLEAPRAGDRLKKTEPLVVRVKGPGDAPAAGLSDLRVTLDGEPVSVTWDPPGTCRLSISGLEAGWHRVTVRATGSDGLGDLRSAAVEVVGPDERRAWRRGFPAAFRAAPVRWGDLLVVAGNDGLVRALDARSGADRWTHSSGAEVLATPAVAGELLLVVDGAGQATALDRHGEVAWRQDLGYPAYAPPLVADGRAYLSDASGGVTAVRLSDGARRWRFERAAFAIEQRPTVWGDLLVFGAWDGFLYALRRADGTLAWKVPGPKSGEGGAARYYAPADCSPVVVGDALLVCDRGYYLGRYDRSGALQEKLGVGVSALVALPDGDSVIARGIDNRVFRLRADGTKLWEGSISAGRLPLPPTLAGERVLICGNDGLLTAADVQTGAVDWRHRVTPGFYVMAPVAADGTHCFVAGMDGSVTALRLGGSTPGG